MSKYKLLFFTLMIVRFVLAGVRDYTSKHFFNVHNIAYLLIKHNINILFFQLKLDNIVVPTDILPLDTDYNIHLDGMIDRGKSF